MFPDRTAVELFTAADEILPTIPTPDQPGRTASAADSLPEASQRGRVLDVHTQIWLDVDERGHVVVRYAYDIRNLTDGPVTRVPRTVWFKHTHDEITVAPVQVGDHQVRIEMQLETDPQKKFAYRISPAVEVGGRAQFGCEIRGGAFVDEFYWRHLALRETELMTMEVVHRSQTLDRIIATEELTDGSEILVSDDVEWSQDGPNLRLRLRRGTLRPTQVVTLRWETNQP